jgi:hypothetical protein
VQITRARVGFLDVKKYRGEKSRDTVPVTVELAVLAYVAYQGSIFMCVLKGTVQRDLRGVKSGINR